jgi:hypothetical protein
MRSQTIKLEARSFLIAITLIMTVSSCAAVRVSSVSKLHPPEPEQSGALRLAEVKTFGTQEEIRNLKSQHQTFIASGLDPLALPDRSVAAGQTYCCGGPSDDAMAMWFYVPTKLELNVGDIVEVKMGRQPDGADPGIVNVAIRIREKSQCRWVPPNPNLWARILFCDWMEQEGWIEKKVS